MTKIENSTETFWIRDQFLVDVVTTPEEYEAYIYNTEYGNKMFMYGLLKNTNSYEDVLKIVESNVEEYIADYAEQYMDGCCV